MVSMFAIEVSRSVRSKCRLPRYRIQGLRRAIAEVFQGAAWRRCAVRLMRDCVREAKTRRLGRRVARIVAPVFRARDADQVRATCHLAADMPAQCRPGAARAWGAAEPDAPACLGFPASHWKRLGTNNVRSAPTGRSGAGRGWRGSSRRRRRRPGWRGPSCAGRTRRGASPGTSRSRGSPSPARIGTTPSRPRTSASASFASWPSRR